MWKSSQPSQGPRSQRTAGRADGRETRLKMRRTAAGGTATASSDEMREVLSSGDILPPLDPRDFEELTTPVEISEEVRHREEGERAVRERLAAAYRDPALQADPGMQALVRDANLDLVWSLSQDSWQFASK